MTCESVDLPEPFGPMIACTSPLFTVSESPWRISRSSTRTCRFLTSSNGILSFLTRHPEVRAVFGEPRRATSHIPNHPSRLASQAPQDDDLNRPKLPARSRPASALQPCIPSGDGAPPLFPEPL